MDRRCFVALAVILIVGAAFLADPATAQRGTACRDREPALNLLSAAVNDFSVRVMHALSPREPHVAERPPVTPLRPRIAG